MDQRPHGKTLGSGEEQFDVVDVLPLDEATLELRRRGELVRVGLPLGAVFFVCLSLRG